MTRCSFISALTAVLLMPTLALADALPEEAIVPADTEPTSAVVDDSPVAAELGWDQFDDPTFDPALEPEAAAEGVVVEGSAFEEAQIETPEVVSDEPSDDEILGSVVGESNPPAGSQIQLEAASATMPTASGGVVLGPRGVDDLGRAGRLHTVATGDTLWDLSAAYLGTPWVWPSVWIDNDDIDNPHLIQPDDKIWITANEMRVVSDAEAESFLSPVADAGMEPEPDPSMDDSDLGAEADAPVAAFDDSLEEMAADEPSTLEAFPVAIAGATGQTVMSGRRITIAERDAMGFVSAEDFEGASSIVSSPNERTFLAQGDDVIIGMGEGDVEIDDQFAIFRVIEEVRDPNNLRLLGHHVESLGWAQVKELTGDTSIAEIRTSYTEIARGAYVIRRDPAPTSVEARSTPDAIEGRIVFLPSQRTLMADGGYVYLDRGEFHGVEMGSELEVFDPGSIVGEPERGVDVRTPDHVVARLVVVSVEPDSSVGFVLWSKRELVVGDSVRPTVPRLAQR
jgi:LysM domain